MPFHTKTSLPVAAVIAAIIISFSCSHPDTTDIPPSPVWKVYTRENSPLPSNTIHTLYVDTDGSVWAGTERGAVNFQSSTRTLLRNEIAEIYASGEFDSSCSCVHSRPDTACDVRAVARAKDGALWFAMFQHGLVRYNLLSGGEKVTRYRTPPLPGQNIVGLGAELIQTGDVWAASFSGAARYRPNILPGTSSDQGGSWTLFTRANSGLPSDAITSMALGIDLESAWFGIYPDQLAWYDFNANIWNRTVVPETEYGINALAFDLTSCWGATAYGAFSVDVHTYVTKAYTPESTHGQYPAAKASAVLTDFGSTRWFGTDSGLVQLSDTSWTRFAPYNSPLPALGVTALAYDHAKNLWIGTTQGLAVYNPKGIR